MERLNSSRSSLSSDGIEQQQQVQMQQQRPQFDVLEHMPHLTDPFVLTAMKTTVLKVARTRSVLQTLGDRPDHEAVDIARARMAHIDDALYRNLEDIHRAQRSSGVDVVSWRTTLEDKEECKAKEEKVKTPYRTVIELDEMHEAYQSLLRGANAYRAVIELDEMHEAYQRLLRGADGGSGLLSMGAALSVDAPATLVTWITVLVLLAFAGKPRRTLVMEGRRITKDIASLAFKNLHGTKEFTRD